MSSERRRNPVIVGIAGALGAAAAFVAVMMIGVRLIASADASVAEYESRMSIFVTVLGVAVAAPCLWLAVRIVNRREPWAKWTAAVTVLTPYQSYLKWWILPT